MYQCTQFTDDSVELGRNFFGHLAIPAHVLRLELLGGNVNGVEVDVDGARRGDGSFLACDSLALQNPNQLRPDARDVVFDGPSLRRKNIGGVAREGRLRCRTLENSLDFSKQLVDVLAGDSKASGLILVQGLAGLLLS